MVNLILMDQEFDKIVDRMDMAIVNTCATNEHVTDAERNVRTIKGSIRDVLLQNYGELGCTRYQNRSSFTRYIWQYSG